MAQSRPPPVRVHTTGASSPPPLSPRTHNSEKKHHSRRKSGKTEYVSSEKKSSRPSTSSRKITPQYINKAGSTGRGHREREEEERGRDSGESFPQFCMSCEKQFLPANNTFLYCSEACRLHDLNPAPTTRTNSYPSYSSQDTHSPPLTPYSRHFPTHEDGPDIIPRFSPTQSRPRSYFASDLYPSSYTTPSHTLSSSTPQHQTYTSTHSSTALESLRELATALPKSSSNGRKGSEPESPPKSSASSMSRNGSAVWGYMPFSSSKTPTPSATPGNSYTATQQPYTVVNQSQSYNTTQSNGYGYPGYSSTNERSREDLYAYGERIGVGGYGNTGGMGMDRPLPPRGGPGGYGHRPKSIDLVTPFGGH